MKHITYKITGIILLVLLSQCCVNHNRTEKEIQDQDNIAEAINIVKECGNKVWPGFNKITFSTLLVTDSIEYLYNHPEPDEEFILKNYNNKLKTDVYTRDITLNRSILACFGICNEPTVIVGIPKNTDRSGVEWIITLVHEYFHQYQSTPDYYRMVDELDLKGDCKTGMWMLNYAFPYDNPKVKEQFRKYSDVLYRLVQSADKEEREELFKEYITEKNNFRALLSDKDYRYFTFQVWQEGMARYTEYKILHTLLENPGLKLNYTTKEYNNYMNRLFKREMYRLKNNNLDKQKRVCFYTIGFAEGLLLDKIDNNWRKHYSEKLSVDHLITKHYN